jgi:hypothetical protein
VSSVLEGFVEALGNDDPGFSLAVTCLSESQARRSGILARRRVQGTPPTD